VLGVLVGDPSPSIITGASQAAAVHVFWTSGALADRAARNTVMAKCI
jgi:histone H3/H4